VLADLLGGLAFDHFGDGFASQVEHPLDVEIIRRLLRGERGERGEDVRSGLSGSRKATLSDLFEKHTKIISKSVAWCTFVNSWSQPATCKKNRNDEEGAVDNCRECAPVMGSLRACCSCSSVSGRSSLWCWQKAITFSRIALVTLGSGMGCSSSSPRSAFS
jgi:hypothetical protein